MAPHPSRRLAKSGVAIKAAGASFVDALQAAGRYQFAAQPPYVPGGEAAGVIDALGEGVDGWSVGDRVFVSMGKGAFADHAFVAPAQLTRLPDGIDLAIGASFMQVYGTAWFAFTKRTTVRPGEVVLVTGAGGGVGLAAIDVARSLGARVIAVASSDEKRALATAMGAEATIDPLSEDIKTRARELTDGAGVDLVYDVAGGDVSEPALRALRFDGRFLVIGFPGGIAKVPLNLVLLNNRTVIGVEWGGWVPLPPRGEPSDDRRDRAGNRVWRPAPGDSHATTAHGRALGAVGAVEPPGCWEDRPRALTGAAG